MTCSLYDTCENYTVSEECNKADEPCGGFECSCARVKFLGSTRHGNYGKCPVCGEEGEI